MELMQWIATLKEVISTFEEVWRRNRKIYDIMIGSKIIKGSGSFKMKSDKIEV